MSFGEGSSLTRSASIDNALEAIEDAFAVSSPEVVHTSGPIISEIPLETYERSIAANAAASNGQSSASSAARSAANLQQAHVSNVSSTVTQPTFATAVAEDGSTVLLMPATGNGVLASNPIAQTQLSYAVASLQQQQQRQLPKLQQQLPQMYRPVQQQQQQKPQQFHYVVPVKTTTIPIITPADSPAEVRQAPSPAYSIHSVPSPASISAPSPKPGPSVSPGPPPLPPPAPVVASSPSSTSSKSSNTLAGKHAGKNLPPLNTSSGGTPNSNAVAAAYNRAANPNPTGTGATPEIIDTPTLTDFISQFPIVASNQDAAAASAAASKAAGATTTTTTTTIRDKTGARVRTDTLGAAVMLSGVNADAFDDDDGEEIDADSPADSRQVQSPSPRGLARSLSTKIDTVDARLEGIRSMLVDQSPDFNMDPSELLNLFMPDGPITTDPRTPIALDDFLEAGASPFSWPAVSASSTKALTAPEDKKIDLSTPMPQLK